MAGVVISVKYPAQIDVTRTPLAYGDRAIPRLVGYHLFVPCSRAHMMRTCMHA